MGHAVLLLTCLLRPYLTPGDAYKQSHTILNLICLDVMSHEFTQKPNLSVEIRHQKEAGLVRINHFCFKKY